MGTAPDSWGVWFPQDPHQVGWKQYLDDVANAGYVWTELGPQGFLPQDPQQLRDELDQRGLKVCGGTVFAGSAQGQGGAGQGDRRIQPGSEAADRGRREVPDPPAGAVHRHAHRRGDLESADIDPEQWSNLISGTNELGRVIYEEFGVELVFHPHADTHVDTQDRIEQFLNDTDPQFVNLCLDTGHIAYCGGDNLQIIERAPERITYVHFKLVDPEVRERVRREKLSLAEAVPLGIMVEPPYGEPQVPPLLDALAGLDRDIYTVIEQDLYPIAAAPPAGHPGQGRRVLHRPAAWAPCGAGRTESC